MSPSRHKFFHCIVAPLLTCGTFALVAAPSLAAAAGAGAHSDPVASVGLSLVAILTAAKLGGDLAVRIGQPGVLGELIAGVLLGNLALVGFSSMEHVARDPFIDMLARIGAIILLFEVGLESTVAQMLKVGLSSFLVGSLGVVVPFLLGWGVGAWLLPGQSAYVHAFLGATLTATSVGITARVLKDLDRSQSDEARIILGAAVIDDVLGLLILAIVTALISTADHGGEFSGVAIVLLVGKACGFLIGSILLGMYLAPPLFSLASRLHSRGALLALGLSCCFFLSWLANALGLAPIVGAFIAGLILDDVHYRSFVDRGEDGLEKLIHPISAFLVPVVFVLMGMRTDLRSFLRPGMLELAAALTIAAIVGKQACSLGVIGSRVDRVVVGLGMIPRGEVGLVFANIGLTLSLGGNRIIDEVSYSAVVVMVIVTTVATVPALKWALGRSDRRRPGTTLAQQRNVGSAKLGLSDDRGE